MKRTRALELHIAGRDAEAEALLRQLGRGESDALHVANEYARMAFEAKADNQYEVAVQLAAKALTVLAREPALQEAAPFERSRRLLLAATLYERVLGDKGTADDLYAQAVAQDANNVAAARARERLRREREAAIEKREAAEREARDRMALGSRIN